MAHCDSTEAMRRSTIRLVGICQKEQLSTFAVRQIPVIIDENLIIKMQINESFVTIIDQNLNKKKSFNENFLKSYEKLSQEELHRALCVPMNQIKEHLLRHVPCIGCRTSIDNFLKLLAEHRHSALEPLVVNEQGSITLNSMYISNPKAIFTLFHVDGPKYKSLMENLSRSKKNRRCQIHSLEKTKSISDWESVWDVMNDECREETTLIEANSFLETLETYLRKHRFCSECKLKVYEAFDILMEFSSYKNVDRKGFSSDLYAGLRSCPAEKHFHVDIRRDFIQSLIVRAEPDIEDGRRERHAKTLDVAQEEILSCIGIYLYERLDKISRTIRSEERTCFWLFDISIECLRLNFEKAVDSKEDFSTTLKLLCDEFRLVDQLKEQKKQQKRSKRKTRRETKTKIEEKSDHRARSTSFCSCLCHYRDKRSNSLSIIHTRIPSVSLVKSQSCPTSFNFVSETLKRTTETTRRLSTSLETLFSSVSTRNCVCHDENLSQTKPNSCDECPSSSSISCLRCSSTRTDLGYSSGQDETSSLGLCDCSSTNGNASAFCCPLHEEDETSDDLAASTSRQSVISSGSFSHNCCVHDTFLDCPKHIELYDRTRKYKLKLQMTPQYPFFHMDLKDVWDVHPSIENEDQSFISDVDLHRFSLVNSNIDRQREQLRSIFKWKYEVWLNQHRRF